MSSTADAGAATDDDTPDAVTPIIRDRAKRVLERDPDLSPAAFAGIMFRETSIAPDTATDLYAELADAGARSDTPTDLESDAGEDTVDQPAGLDAWADETGESDAESTPAPGARETSDDGESAENGGAPAPPAPPEPPAPAADDVDPAIALHYDRLEDAGVYANLGTIDGGLAGADTALSCLGNQDFGGWYKKRPAGGAWDQEGRAYALAKEFDDLRDGLERVLYATLNYTPTRWFMEAWDRYQWVDGEREWESGDGATPDYGDVFAYAPFADIDLVDGAKKARAGHRDLCLRSVGGNPADVDGVYGDGTGWPRRLQDSIEDALRRYVDAFADLAGGREHVFVLDSVGGAYVMIAPTSTSPIAAEFDREDRDAIFDELTSRLDEWLEDVANDVTAATGLADVFEPDLLNNNNRLYKAPLSVHSSLDGVVTPVDRDAPRYDFTPLEDVDGELVDETQAWADGFTADHRDAVDAIVATLWSDHYADAGGWKDALEAWLEDHREEKARNQERENERIPPNEIPDDLETTDDLDVIKSKIEGIAVDELIADTIGAAVEGVTTDDSKDGIRFDPPWRGSNSGKSCFADYKKFYDPDAKYSGGGALEFIAVERGIVNRPGDKLTGDKYWRAVNALREEGYHIPYFEGHPDANGKHGDVLRLFTEPKTEEDKKRQLARALFADR